MFGAPYLHTARAMMGWHGPGRMIPAWSPGMWISSLVLVACSETGSSPSTPSPSCEELRRLPDSSIERGSATDLVWLMTKPNRLDPLVVNLEDARIAGKPGRIVSRREPGQSNPTRWLITEEHAISLRRVDRELVQGEWLRCGDGSVTSYSLSPLAPRVATASSGFVERSRFPEQALAWPHERTSDITLVGKQLLAVARGPDGLRILQRHDGGDLEEVSHLAAPLGDDYNDVMAIDERHVAVASARHGLLIVDLTVPEAPEITASDLPAIAPRDGHSVVVDGTRLFLAQAPVMGTGAVVLFDVSNPAAPRELSRWSAGPGEDAHDVSVRGSRVCVSSLRGGITVLDWAFSDAPRVVARLAGLGAHSSNYIGDGNVGDDAGHDAAERWLWAEEQLGGSLHVVQIAETRATEDAGSADADGGALPSGDDTVAFDARPLPTRLLAPWGSNEWISSAASPHQAHCEKSVCFIAHYQLGLRVLDVRQEEDGQEPQLRAWYPTWKVSEQGERTWLRGASGVAVDGTRVYVADTESGIVVLDYSPATHDDE